MGNKRLEDCNLFVRIWRYRWYTVLPFKLFWYKFFGIPDIKNKNLMNISISEIQIKILDYKSTLKK